MDETTKLKNEVKDLEARVKKLESVLFGFSNTKTHTDKIRGLVIDGEHTAGKPIIVSSSGKRYNIQTV